MQRPIIQERISPLRQPVPTASEPERVVSVMVVYEEASARRWADETYEKMFVGPDREKVQSTWWKLDELGDPAVLAGAVSKAMRADVIVVAIRATEGFPLPFYVWVSSWLPHSMPDEGKLVALIATPKQPGFQRNRAGEYLRAVAQRGGMHFLLKERNCAVEAPSVAGGESRKGHLTIMPAPPAKPTPLYGYSIRPWRMAA
jgi:hypothetical protein